MKTRKVTRWKPAALLGSLAFAVLWQLAAWISGPAFLPGPVAVIKLFFVQLTTPGYLGTVLASYQRVLVGWGIGSLVGMVGGILMGRYASLGQFLYSPIQFFRVIPAIAIVPILVIWLGVGETIKYVIIGYGVALVVAVNIADAVQRVAQVRLQAARSMGAGPIRIFWGVLVPSVMPEVLKGVRGSLAFAFMSIVGIETLAAQDGVGKMIWNARVLHQTDVAILGIVTLGLMGVLADLLVQALFRLFGYRFMMRR
ncbi:ABC transporter permease [Paenibacillus sp. IB182496]|uniref:ABC transporter permease n=1 Tax=Paenibacillus sabuli TaxID=2772509 RepID=A0A927GQY2_9BACL|nr:ABC transporter permease [Paenibacillus sabuli]MBD2844350.1 ABC transporter permease [Paenibacillus sabuli]